MNRSIRITTATAALLFALPTRPALAQQHTCAYWAAVAEQHYQMPNGLMRAIVQHESKGNANALNVDGKGYYFSSAIEAATAIRQLTPRSYEVDVGCSQITIRWHGQKFNSIGAMLDPRTNLSYASWHLNSLKEKYGTWLGAISRYHSYQPERGRKYACRVWEIMRDNGGAISSIENPCI